MFNKGHLNVISWCPYTFGHLVYIQHISYMMLSTIEGNGLKSCYPMSISVKLPYYSASKYIESNLKWAWPKLHPHESIEPNIAF